MRNPTDENGLTDKQIAFINEKTLYKKRD